MISTPQKSQGFTIIEAIVSMALFAIAFSGLYFFFGMAQQANNNSEKRMYLNLMGNQILETIHAEAFRGDDDVANPFVTPTSYTANLSDCSTYTAPDVRHTWCTELDASIGPHKGVHADELRTVEVIKDETNLIVNVTLVADGGTGSNNLIKTFLSRKIAPPRRSTPPEACLENHNKVLAYMQSQKTQCNASTIPFITYTVPYYSDKVVEFKISCPDYKFMDSSAAPIFYPGMVGQSITDAMNYEYFANMWGMYHYQEIYGGTDTGNNPYGADYPYSPSSLFSYGTPGNSETRRGYGLGHKFCIDTGADDINNRFIPGLSCSVDRFAINVTSCCPGKDDKIVSGSGSGSLAIGKYKQCNPRPKTYPEYYKQYTGGHVTFP